MAITKPPVLPAWADAGDKVQPSNAELSVGWPVSSTPPSRQRFNWVLNFVANAVRYFSRRGLVDYDAAETYMTGDRVIGDDGKTYRSLVDNNTAQTPSTQPTKWERWGFSQSDLGANAQTQPYTAFTTTGATGAFVLTPSPALTAYAANQRFRVKFHAVGNGSDTLAVSGLATKSLKQYDATGAKVAPVIAANQLVDVEYDGIDFVLLDPLPVSSGMFVSRDAQGNVGIGATPKTWSAYFPVLQLNAKTAIGADANSTYYGTNWYQGGGQDKRLAAGFALQYWQDSSAAKHIWKIAPNGAADSAIAWTQAMTLDASTGVLDVPAGVTVGGSSLQRLSDFPVSLSGSGYQKLPGGLIIQWGIATASAATSGTTTVVTYPIAFPTGTFIAMATPTTPVSGVSGFNTTSTNSTSATFQRSNYSSLDSGTQFQWIAIGR